jgi:glucose/mannose-6-phosphate isomerase
LRSLASPAGRKPVHVVRGFEAPAFVGGTTLVVACSHSGNTEETLSALEGALAAGANAVAVTQGGRLLELARERGLPTDVYQFAGGPRSAIGHQLMALLAIGEQAGLLERQDAAVEEAVALMRELRGRLGFAAPSGENAAKQLAGRLYGRLPVIVGAGVLADAAHRWKTQLNENAKSWAVWEELPELGHNTIVGFGLPRDLVERVRALFLFNRTLPAKIARQYEATAAELTKAGAAHERVEVGGSQPLAQLLSAIYHGDLVSYYLALLYGEDPSPVAPIVRFKAALADG